MIKMLSMLKIQVLQTVRDRGELISILVLPLLLTYVFGVAFGSQGAEGPVRVLWLDGDSSVYAQEIRSIAATEPSIEIEDATQDQAEERLDSGEAGVAVRIPVGFGDDLEAGTAATVELIVPPDSQRGQAAAEIVQGAIARVSANAEAAHISVAAVSDLAAQTGAQVGEIEFADAYDVADSYWEPDPPVGVTGEQVVASDVRGDEVFAASNIHYSVGFTLMFVLFVSFGSAQGILEEREQGTLRRLLVTPASRPIILGGKSLGIIGVASMEALILIGVGALVFGVPWGSDPLAVILLVAGYVLAASGLALLVTAVARTRSQLSATGPIVATALAMLGGCYWPIEITPASMQLIAKFTPTGWAMSGLLDVVARHQGLGAALLPAAVLFGMASLFFVLGLWFLKID